MLRKHQRFGLGLIILAILVVGGVTYANSTARQAQPVFSGSEQLEALWNVYKVNNIDATSGRTLDKTQNNLTTSEGESYTMLRAAWEDDRTTFDKSLSFTNNNLRHKSDALFAWRYGSLGNNTYGILTNEGGNNTASDADSDIALALIFGASRWQQQSYLDQAKQVLAGIWQQEVVTVNGKPLLVADNLERANQTNVLVNPSYISPGSYEIFSRIDKAHDWKGLENNSYTFLTSVTGKTLAGQVSVGLPPDWIEVNRKTGALSAPTDTNLTTNFSFDAMRAPFRLALAYSWTKDKRALAVLQRMSFLGQQWTNNNSIRAGYSQSGSITANYESPAIYGAVSAYFKYADTADYDKLYQDKLQILYNADKQTWKNQLSYYDDNWTWFGMALHDNALTDLSTS